MIRSIVRDISLCHYTIAKFVNGEQVSSREETRLNPIGAREMSKLAQNGEAIISQSIVIDRREMSIEKFYEMSEPARKPKRIYKRRNKT